MEGANLNGEPAELGPLALGEERRFVLAVGSAPNLPTFRVRLMCRGRGRLLGMGQAARLAPVGADPVVSTDESD